MSVFVIKLILIVFTRFFTNDQRKSLFIVRLMSIKILSIKRRFILESDPSLKRFIVTDFQDIVMVADLIGLKLQEAKKEPYLFFESYAPIFYVCSHLFDASSHNESYMLLVKK